VTRTMAGSGECDGNGMGDGSGAMRAFEASSRVRWTGSDGAERFVGGIGERVFPGELGISV